MTHPREGGRKFPFVSDPSLTRRDFLRRSATAAATVPLAGAILAACGKNPRTQPIGSGENGGIARPNNPVTLPVDQSMMIGDGLASEQGPLQIYNWEQYISPRTIKNASAALGVDINVTTFNTMDEAISKLTNGKLEYDIFFPTKDIIGRLVAVGLIRPLNHSYLPNLSNVWSSFTDPGKPFWDVGQQYTVPYTIYTTGIGYRVDANAPNAHITRDVSQLGTTIPSMDNPYDILWDTSWKPYVHLMNDYREALSMAMLRRGVTDINTDKASTRTKVIDQARDDLIEGVNTMDWKFDISDYTDLPEAQSYIHQGWSGDFVSVQYYYPSWSPRDVIKYWYPPNHQGAVGGDHISILAGGKNPVLAHKFLDFMLDFDNSMINFTWVGYQPPQKQITDPNSLLKNSPNPLTPYNVIPPQLATAVVSQDDFDQGYQELELAPDVDNMWKSAWEAVQTA